MKNEVKEKPLNEHEKKIISFLKKQDNDLSISVIAKAVTLSWNTAEKYLKLLEAKKVVECRDLGNTLLFKIRGGENEKR